MEIGWSSVVARRMHRQGLAEPLIDSVSAVSAMGGAHAQVMSAAELSIGVRVANATPEAIRGALRVGGSLVKTYGPRGTVHVLPRAELSHWCAALGAVPLGSSLPADGRLAREQMEEAIAAIGDSLATLGPLVGDQLDEAVTARLDAWATERVVPAFGTWWPRWRLAIQAAAYRGVLAFGDSQGSRVTYLNPGVLPEVDSYRALGWLLQRYLSTYGPAAPEHYGRWLGARKTWASSQFAAHRNELQAVTVDGVPAFVNRADTWLPPTPLRGVNLLPHFDPYVIGSFPRDRLFPGAASTRALGRGQAGVHPVLLIDGIVAGVWSGRRTGSRLAVTVEPTARLTRAQRAALDVAANRVGAFVDLESELIIGPVRVAAHR